MWSPLSPDAIGAVLAGLTPPWWVAGGWAVDRRLGRQTRPHHDLDVAVLRRDAGAVRSHLAAWDLHLAGPPGTLRPWPVGEPVPATAHGVWGRPSRGEPWAFELLLEDADGDEWTYRRDPRVRRPLGELGDGVLALDVQLLYKSKAPRPVDEADFAAALPVLSAAERAWLATALDVTAPGHPWRARLAG